MKPLSPFSSPKTSAGCIAGLLHRIFCLRSLSTCSFDYLKEDADERSDGTVVPGVVARLMGLESLPLIPSTDSTPSFKKLKSRVIPITYQEFEDDNFFIFTFDVERKRSHKRTRRRDGDRLCEKNSCETQDNSEHSSPGSALEFVGFPSHHLQPSSSLASSGDVSRLRNSRMRRTLSGELEKCDTKGVLMTSSNAVFGEEEVKRQWDEIGSEVAKLSWVEDEMYRNLKEIGRDISSQILSMLLDELLLI